MINDVAQFLSLNPNIFLIFKTNQQLGQFIKQNKSRQIKVFCHNLQSITRRLFSICQTEVRADLSHSRVNQQKAEAKEVTLEKLSVLIVLINVIKAGIE